MRPRYPAALAVVCLAAALAGGCAPLGIGLGSSAATAPTIEERRPDPAEQRLAEAASRAELALTTLARIEVARTPPPSALSLADVPPELRRPVTLDWIGPVETLAETLAQYAGYRFAMAGPSPVRPAMVAVWAEDVSLIEVLRDAGLQAGSAATLVVDAGRRTVRLDWSGERPGKGERPRAAPGKEGS
ncbi:MAG: DotD/TraH family lipoprotein [Alphaproteobacteria bacterium]|nr:DotD/TraH family lipoprotein [Alphaproteobacteria bacterium]